MIDTRFYSELYATWGIDFGFGPQVSHGGDNRLLPFEIGRVAGIWFADRGVCILQAGMGCGPRDGRLGILSVFIFCWGKSRVGVSGLGSPVLVGPSGVWRPPRAILVGGWPHWGREFGGVVLCRGVGRGVLGGPPGSVAG